MKEEKTSYHIHVFSSKRGLPGLKEYPKGKLSGQGFSGFA